MDTSTLALTDAGNAEAIALLYGDRLRFDHKRGRWLIWSDNWWTCDNNGGLTRIAMDSARQRFTDTLNLEGDKRIKAATWATRSENRSAIESALAIARALPPITDTGIGWDSDSLLIGVGDGVIDLRQMVRRNGKCDDKLTHHSPINFDINAKCPRWESFLKETFVSESLIDWVWRAVGYSSTGLVDEQCLFMCWGSGANGKSTFLGAIRKVLGDYAMDTPFSTFEADNRNAINNDVARLDGARFVTSIESAGHRLNEARIKAVTGGDTISARFLHHEFFDFKPILKLWFSANVKPRVADDSHGFWRRVRLIPFTQTFDGDKRDSRLEDKLSAESEGILTWIVKGAKQYLERGLSDIPSEICAATEAYRQESDPLSQFISDRLIDTPESMVRSKELYENYREWAQSEGMELREIMTSTAFGKIMSKRYNKIHKDTGWYYKGLSIFDPEMPQLTGLLTGLPNKIQNGEVIPIHNSSRGYISENPSEPVSNVKPVSQEEFFFTESEKEMLKKWSEVD